MGLQLRPFADRTVDDWKSKGPDCTEIRECLSGWDVTDFGRGNFEAIGRVLFTLRNGAKTFPPGKDYAEKFILDPKNQRPPRHYHRHQMEDIINRGGGNRLVHR